MLERIIVSLTTWEKRIQNIPAVLDTIFNQKLPPDFVVLNLAYEESVPQNVQRYLDEHDIEVNRVPDTKVYKKLLPTINKYPDDCIICIDDDWLYPEGMIEDFMAIHQKYPDNPISGNRIVVNGMQCHCGCASLTKASYFGTFVGSIDESVFINCPSDDIVYTYFSTKAGHPYVRTKNLYFGNMIPYKQNEGYSDMNNINIVQDSLNYLTMVNGEIEKPIYGYIKDQYLADIIDDIMVKSITDSVIISKREVVSDIYRTYPYRIGNAIIKPLLWIKKLCFEKK